MLVATEPGTRIGPYAIVALLGRGGMGEVYRAHDTRLNRDVAIKLLPADFAAQPVRRTRFEREALTISQLNHPHICTVYDAGTADGVAYIVMEWIDGESLARRLRRGPIPWRTVVRWSIQIASALDAAHRRGITHRDLKPANVMVADETVKLLDFGLATLPSEDRTNTTEATDSTISLTAERSILGSRHYMAPEQLEGRAVDPRTDLFAFGALLYEMLTARRAFDGSSEAAVTAAILTSTPQPVSVVEDGVPAALDRIVQRALAKDPNQRWQTARDLMNELQWIAENGSHGTLTPVSATVRRRLTLFAVGATALVAGFAAHAILWPEPIRPVTPIHLSFDRPAGVELTNTGRPVLAISPDGKQIVFNANNQLYLRKLETGASVPISGTQGTGVTTPFFSPDGRWVGFFAVETRELKKIPVDGGAPVTIATAGSTGGNFGASWTTDDQVLFATGDGVFRVSSNGGTPQKVVAAGDGEHLHGPQLLPDGDHVLLTVTTANGPSRWDQAQIIAHSLSSGRRTVLVDHGADGRYLEPGQIVYAIGNTLFAVPLNLRTMQVAGPPATVLANVRRAATPAVNTASAFFAVSRTGDLVYVPNDDLAFANVFVDLSGRLTPLPEQRLFAVRVSPDGAHAIASRNGWLWIVSLTHREAPRRLDEADGANTNAVWTPDGTHIAFRSRVKSTPGIFWRTTSGGDHPDLLVARDGAPVGWSRDGKTLYYIADRRLWSWSRGEEPHPLMPMDSPYASLSPDGRWIAFHTREHGQMVPYIQSLADLNARFQVAPTGHAPLWAPDGRRLFFVSGETNSLMSIAVHTTPTVAFGEPLVIVPQILHGWALSERWYDVTPDGTHLVVQVPTQNEPWSRQIEVVLNWIEDVKRQTAAH